MAEFRPEEPLRIQTTEELLKAVELGIVDKTEARSMLGLPVKRGRLAKLQPRQSGRFVKGDLVYPLSRFSATAQTALIRAQDLAQAEGRAHVETGDMLLALLEEASGAGARALQSLGIGEPEVRSTLARVERGEDAVEGVGPTTQLKAVVETAFGWVAYPDQVGTGHLVLALASREGRASDALALLGAQERQLRAVTDLGAGGDAES